MVTDEIQISLWHCNSKFVARQVTTKLLVPTDTTVTDLVPCSFVSHVQIVTIFAIYPCSILCLSLCAFSRTASEASAQLPLCCCAAALSNEEKSFSFFPSIVTFLLTRKLLKCSVAAICERYYSSGNLLVCQVALQYFPREFNAQGQTHIFVISKSHKSQCPIAQNLQ